MFEKTSKLLELWNKRGILLPMISDPKTGKGSLTASMFWASFTFCLFCGIVFIATAIAKWAEVFSPGDNTQEAVKNASQYALQLYIASGAAYLGRKIMNDSKGNITSDGESKPPSASA